MRKIIHDLMNATYIFESKSYEYYNFVNETTYETVKSNLVHTAQRRASSIDTIIESIIHVQITKRLSSYLVPFDEFNVQLDKIKNNLTENEEIPHNTVYEYYHKLKVEHEIIADRLRLTVEIPIAQKTNWTLYKIDEFPARSNDSLLVTNVGWKYFANSSNEYTMFTGLESCFPTKDYFLCESQSSIHLKSEDDCLTNAFVTHMMNPKLCKTVSVPFKQLTFIRLSNGKYFYYVPGDDKEEISIICKETKKETLTKSGVIILMSACSVKTAHYELAPTEYSNKIPPLEKILTTGFDPEYLEGIASGNLSVIDENPFYGNVERLHDKFYVPQELTMDSSTLERDGWQKWHFYLIGAAVAVILLLICIFRTCCCGWICC